jgi:hypothetical protein
MIQVRFMRWYPFIREIPSNPHFKLDEIIEYVSNEDWLDVVNWLLTLGFYVAIHKDENKNLITVMIDTTWFKVR